MSEPAQNARSPAPVKTRHAHGRVAGQAVQHLLEPAGQIERDEVERRVVQRDDGDAGLDPAKDGSVLIGLLPRRAELRRLGRYGSPAGGSSARAGTGAGPSWRSGSATRTGKPIRSRTSRRRSMPGATSSSSMPSAVEAEDRALGHVHHLLAALARVAAVEGQLLHLRGPTSRCGPPARSASPPAPSGAASRPPVVSVPENTTLRAPWLMLMKPPGPLIERAVAADVDVALAVDLGERQEGEVEPAAVVEVELVGLVGHHVVVDAGAGVHAAGRHAADDALLDGERHFAPQALFGGDVGDPVRDPEAEVDHGTAGTAPSRRAARSPCAGRAAAAGSRPRAHAPRRHRPGCSASGRSGAARARPRRSRRPRPGP